ncbi:hypothetical protein [Methylomonas sp. MgM2]
MTQIDVIESVYHDVIRPALNLQHLATALRHWYQAFPKTNYLQPCLINGKASLICQKELSDIDSQAYRALKSICSAYGIYLKEDARRQYSTTDFLHNRRKAAVILTFCLTMTSNVYAANVRGHAVAAASSIESQKISIAFKNQTLSDVVGEIADQTGIRFKFDTPVENDIINKKLIAPDWHSALDQLLQSYNYMTIKDGKAIKTIFISGYKGGMKPTTPISDPEPYPPEDVFDDRIITDIAVPTEELSNLPEGGNMMVDLPVGTFNVKRESMVALDDGTLSWVGVMDDESQFYRLYLTKSQDGEVVGTTYTPNGTYHIETIDGQTVMIEANQASMR